jgi:CHAD domain-containing protein
MARSEEITGLTGAESVHDGARQVLRTRLNEMCGFRERALDWSDVEGVHDMRVAARRLRSALRDFLPFLRRAGKLRQWNAELRELAATLGAVRDQDVALAALRELAEKAPDEQTQAGLALFVAEREALLAPAREALVEAVAPDRLEVLQARFVLAYDHIEADDPTPLRETGQRIAVAGWDDFARLSRSLYAPFRVRPLHRLRIAAKRLRYALELFTPYWPPDTLAPLAAQVAEMQGALGDLHDCDLWLDDFGQRLAKPLTDPDARHAAFWLMRHFSKERTQRYRDALALWHDWETNKLDAQLATALDHDVR